MSLCSNFQEIKGNSDINGSMPIAIASVLKDKYDIQFSKNRFDNCKVMLTFNVPCYELPNLMSIDMDIWVMHTFGSSIEEFFKNIISDDIILYLVDCKYTKAQQIDFEKISINFYFEYFKRPKNILQPGSTVYG
jgi:hypothetical protein